MYSYLRKTGEPPQTERQRWLKASILAASIGTIVPATGFAATIQGNSFFDMNDNGVRDTCEPVRPNGTIFIRDNNLANSGQGGFFTTMTDANGRYQSPAHNAGPFTIWADIPFGQRQTSPVRGEGFVMHDFTIANANQTVAIDFGIFDPTPNGAPNITVPSARMTANMDSQVNFTANFNDGDGDKLCAATWDFGDGSTASSLNAAHTYTAPGTYTAKISATDSRGATASAQVRVTVQNVRPTVTLTANPTTVGICNATRLTGTATDTASDRLTHQLTLGDGTTVNGLTANRTYANPGRYTARLVSTDRFGLTGQATVAINVQNTAPTVNASFASNASPIRITDVINFSGQVTDPDSCDRHTYQWTFGDGGTASTLNASHSYTTKGTYTARLTVRDRFGGVTTKTLTVQVLGAVPVVRLGPDMALDVAEPFDFSGTFSDADGQPRYDYTWRFGDGNTSVGRRWSTTRSIDVTHAFNESGEFTLTLEVTDRDGNTGSDSMVVNVRGINTDPCAAGVATVRSRLPWGLWDRTFSWDTNQIPGPNDWVLIQGGHNVVLPDTNQISVRGICIAQNGMLQSAFNRLGSPPSRLSIFAASIRNQGTLHGSAGINGAGPMNNTALYRHATSASNLLIYVNRFVNDATGQVFGHIRGGGRGGNDQPYIYLPHWARMDAIGGRGGQVEIYPAIFINNGIIQGGNGGDADAFNGWNDLVDGNASGGNGGLVRVFATNLAMSSNGATGRFTGGCGGYADGVGLWATTTITTTITNTNHWYRWFLNIIRISTSTNTSSNTVYGTRRNVQGGRGGNVSVNLGNISGITTGCTGRTFNQTLHNTVRNTVRRTRWVRIDPTLIKMDSTTRIGDTENLVLFAGEGATIDLRELREGAISADDTITISVGKGGVVDLRGVNAKVFKAGQKLSIFADEIRLDSGVTVEDLTDAPEVVVMPSKILYNVELSYAEHVVGEPNAVIPVKLTILNGGPSADTYTLTATNSAGQPVDTLPATLTVNGLRRSELVFDLTVPETSGTEDIITVTVTSQGDPNAQAVANIRVGVKEEERITPRSADDEKADIVLAIDDSSTMASVLLMVSNALEEFMTQFDDSTTPTEAEVETFLNQFDEDNPPTAEQMEAFLAQKAASTENNGPTFELLTFKDDVTSRVVTKDLGDVIARVRSIQPSGGDDCSNASVAAIDMALENLNQNGQIVLATASSPHLATAAAIAKAKEQGAKVHVLLAGSCENETAEKALYQGIADDTYGTFSWLPRGGMSEVEIEQVITTVVEDSLTEVTEMVKERDQDDDTDEEPPVTPASCMIYGVQDKGLNDSIFFAIDLQTEEVTQLGPIYDGYDIEAMTVSRDANILYVASGNDTDDPLLKGHLYYLDASTGELVAIGATGFEEIGGLAFAGDGTLWAWAKGDGLVQLNPVTGQGTLVIPSPALLEDITATRDGTVLYGSLDDQLWSYDPTTETLTLECSNLERETEAVEFLLNGFLLLGRNGERSLMLHAFDIATCAMVANRNLKVPFNDVEGLAVPYAACLR